MKIDFGKIEIFPTTKNGKRSLWLMAGFFLLFAVLLFFAAFGVERGETIFSNFFLAIPIFSAWTLGLLAFIFAITAVIWEKERSPLVILNVLFGLAILSFILGEIFIPH
jgi:hypothetical protein